VSSPTPRTSLRLTPASWTAASNVWRIAAIATFGPSVTRLGSSTSLSIRYSPARLMTVNLLAVPPMSMPTM